jgi:hypothetical protein
VAWLSSSLSGQSRQFCTSTAVQVVQVLSGLPGGWKMQHMVRWGAASPLLHPDRLLGLKGLLWAYRCLAWTDRREGVILVRLWGEAWATTRNRRDTERFHSRRVCAKHLSCACILVLRMHSCGKKLAKSTDRRVFRTRFCFVLTRPFRPPLCWNASFGDRLERFKAWAGRAPV